MKLNRLQVDTPTGAAAYTTFTPMDHVDVGWADESAPWTDLARSGVMYHPVTGEHDLSLEVFNTWVDNVVRTGREVLIDFEHNSIFHPEAEHANNAAGYVAPNPDHFRLDRRTDRETGEPYDVLQARTQWTDPGKEYIRNNTADGAAIGPGLSPVFFDEFPDPRTNENQGPTLINIGLTTDRFGIGLNPAAASNYVALSARPIHAKGSKMELQELRDALGIAGDANEEVIVDTIKTMREAAEAEPAEPTPDEVALSAAVESAGGAEKAATALSNVVAGKLVEADKLSEKDQVIAELGTKVTALSSDLSQLAADRDTEKRDTAITGLVEKGMDASQRETAELMWGQGEAVFAAFSSSVALGKPVGGKKSGGLPDDAHPDTRGKTPISLMNGAVQAKIAEAKEAGQDMTRKQATDAVFADDPELVLAGMADSRDAQNH